MNGKCKLKTRTLIEKYIILKDLEKLETSVSLSQKYGTPKQIISEWIKDKFKIFAEISKSPKAENENLSL